MSNSANSINDEQALFESVLADSDLLLLDSLRLDEQRRRRRRLMFVSLVVGGVAMFCTTLAVLAGWLTLAAPPPVESPPASLSATQSATADAWVERLKGLRDHMHTAFGVGPDLTLLDPELGLEVVRLSWSQIKEPDVKTGLLKTFAFSKALPNKHPKLFQVLDLGMNDEDPKIRAYAASYVSEYSGVDFTNDPEGYQAWFKEFGDKTPGQVLAMRKSDAAERAIDPSTMTESDKLAAAGTLATTGWQLWQQQKFAEAADKFEQAVQLDPESTIAWNGLGWSRFNSGDSSAAVPAFERCVELEPSHPAALNGLGQVYLSWGEFDMAKKYLTKAAPQAPAAWFGLARLYLLTGKYTAAERWIKKALATNPGDESLQKMLAAAESKQLPDELRKKIEPPGKPKTLESTADTSTGWQQFQQGQLRLAERSFRRALAKDPEDTSAMNGLGFCLLNNGQAAAAKENFEKCLKLDPDAAGAMNGLARCLKAEGKIDEAIAEWEKMREKFPGPTAATTGLATTYLEQGDYKKALPLYEQLVKSMPDNAEFKQGLEAAKKGAAN
jgi:tetratricopeptide (TPR) repeat protein